MKKITIIALLLLCLIISSCENKPSPNQTEISYEKQLEDKDKEIEQLTEVINQLSIQVTELTEVQETQSKKISQLSRKHYIADEFNTLNVGMIKPGGKIYFLPDESSDVFIDVVESNLDVKVYYILDNGWAVVQNSMGSPLGYCRQDFLLPIEGDIPYKKGTIDIKGIVLGQPFQLATDIFGSDYRVYKESTGMGIVYSNDNLSSSFIYDFHDRITTIICRDSLMEIYGYHNAEEISKLVDDLVNKYVYEKNEFSYIFIISEDEYLEIYYREDGSLLIMESFILRNTKYML